MSYTFTSSIKNYPNNEDLSNQIEFRDIINNIFKSSKTILMVGWRQSSDQSFVEYMINQGKDLTIVEIFEPNISSIPSNVKTILGDIRTLELKDRFDLFLWQHGPEHCKQEESINVLNKFKKQCKHIIIETPNGHNQQDEMYGNIYERHVSEWYQSDYEKLGFISTIYAGPKNDSFIVGYIINDIIK